jgi:hypothetical protein
MGRSGNQSRRHMHDCCKPTSAWAQCRRSEEGAPASTIDCPIGPGTSDTPCAIQYLRSACISVLGCDSLAECGRARATGKVAPSSHIYRERAKAVIPLALASCRMEPHRRICALAAPALSLHCRAGTISKPSLLTQLLSLFVGLNCADGFEAHACLPGSGTVALLSDSPMHAAAGPSGCLCLARLANQGSSVRKHSRPSQVQALFSGRGRTGRPGQPCKLAAFRGMSLA